MSYSSLMDYNNYTAGGCQAPQAPRSAMAVQVVPVYSPPGYETLTHGPCAFDHLDITQAYPSNCDKFIQRLCDCTCKDGVSVKPTSMPPPVSPMPMPMPMPSPSSPVSMARDVQGSSCSMKMAEMYSNGYRGRR